MSGAENPPAHAGLPLLNLETFDTLLEAQVLVERWWRHYNAVRPHTWGTGRRRLRRCYHGEAAQLFHTRWYLYE